MMLSSVPAATRPHRRTRWWSCAVPLVIGIASLTACNRTPPPTLVGVFPTSGYARQLIGVDGIVTLASVVWDPGLASETVITNGIAGTRYFQIPVGAAPGAHQIKLRNSGGDSTPATVTVIGCDPRSSTVETDSGHDGPGRPPINGDDAIDNHDLPVATGPDNSLRRVGTDSFPGLVKCGAFPGPRIEDIAIYRATDYGGNYAGVLANFLITVSAANLDTNARVSVARIAPTAIANRTLSSCVRWGGLPIDYLQHHVPMTFRYPIYHYSQMLCPLEHNRYGSTIRVSVTNSDGKSDSRNYTLPASLAALDSDNDGLSDALENDGKDDVNLPAMGANPLRKSVFVQADWMPGGRPMDSLWENAKAAFAAAPVLNPDGSAGIDLFIDRGQDRSGAGPFRNGGETLPYKNFVDFEIPEGADPNYHIDFDDLKTDHFAPSRKGLFHYAVFGISMESSASGSGEVWGDDFILAFVYKAGWDRLDAQVAAFVHELGHNLALRHGSFLSHDIEQATARFKPNQISVMNYRFLVAESFGNLSGVSLDCDYRPDVPLIISYAQGMMADINEAAVLERRGICDNKPLDLNGDGVIATVPTQMNTNAAGEKAPGPDVDPTELLDDDDVHREFDEWGNLRLNFAGAKDASD